LFNVLGVLAWVSVTAVTGYAVGGSNRSGARRLSLISFGILVVVVALVCRAARRSPRRAWWRRRLAVIHRVNAQLLVLLAALGASTWLFVDISQDVVDHDGIALSDPRLLADALSRRTSALTVVVKVVTFLGTDVVVYVLLAVVGVLVWRRTRRWQPLFLALAWLGAGQLVRLAINQAIGRPRPPQHLQLVAARGYAFPSGHTTTATIGFGLLVALAVVVAPRSRRWAATAAVVLALAVGLSRVYLGVHWPTDVLGGWSLGAAWLALGATIILSVRLIFKRGNNEQPPLVDPVC
jgi:membrane-associated phospholipid phosphatase